MRFRAKLASRASLDDETGLYYYGARYYAAWLGRWTSADPLGLRAGLNLYLYGRASPVVYRDPSGMFDVMAMASLGQTAATNAAFSAADAEARSWAPDSSDVLYEETARSSTEYDPNTAAAAMAEPASRAEPTVFTEPGNIGFGTDLVSPGELYEQAQLDLENAWRQEVLERGDYGERDLRGHKLWSQNPETGEMELARDRYLELPVGTSDVEVQLAIGGTGRVLSVGANKMLDGIARWRAGAVSQSKAAVAVEAGAAIATEARAASVSGETISAENTVAAETAGPPQYFIQSGVRRSVSSREAAAEDIPATIFAPGQKPVLTRVPLNQLHSPKTEILRDPRFLRIQPPIHTPIELEPLGLPGQVPSIPLWQVKIR